MVGTRWALWKVTQYPSYVSWVAAAVWNVYLAAGWDLPDQKWTYVVILGWRGKSADFLQPLELPTL